MNTPASRRLLRNLQIGFGASLLILVITSVASWSSIRNLMDSSKWVDHTDSVLLKLAGISTVLRDAESGQRGYLLTGDTSFLRAFNGAQDRVHALVDSIETMVGDNASQRINLKSLREVVFEPVTLMGLVINQKKTDNLYSLDDVRKARDYMGQTRVVLGRMEMEEHHLMETRVAQVRTYSNYTPVLIVVAASLS
ncbi:MAG TPA: CHASE3 domain-containing protein, partial [Puia sp.]